MSLNSTDFIPFSISFASTFLKVPVPTTFNPIEVKSWCIKSSCSAPRSFISVCLQKTLLYVYGICPVASTSTGAFKLSLATRISPPLSIKSPSSPFEQSIATAIASERSPKSLIGIQTFLPSISQSRSFASYIFRLETLDK